MIHRDCMFLFPIPLVLVIEELKLIDSRNIEYLIRVYLMKISWMSSQNSPKVSD